MSQWDIYLANVPFEDVPQSKVRPVLVIDDTAVIIDCIKMTSKPPRRGEYVLKDWENAGLHKQTAVRISKRLRLEKARLIKQIGKLQLNDIVEIQKLIS